MQSQNLPLNQNQNLNIGSNFGGLVQGKPQNTQQTNFNFSMQSQNLPIKQNQNLNIGSNFGVLGQGQPQNKKNSDFDFFQNAKPVEQGLKINKINPTFKNDDLI